MESAILEAMWVGHRKKGSSEELFPQSVGIKTLDRAMVAGCVLKALFETE
jgi:hypothetical protein